MPGLAEAEDVAPVPRHNAAIQVALIPALIAAIIAAPIAGVYVGYRTFITPTTARGTCFILDENQCESLSLKSVEQMSHVGFPDETEVLRSGSSRTLRNGSAYALLRLPMPGSAQLPAAAPELSGLTPSTSQRWAEIGLATVDQHSEWQADQYSYQFVAGRGLDGGALAYVSRTWNG